MKDHVSALSTLPPLGDATRRWSIIGAPSKRPPVRVVATRGRTSLAYELTYWTQLQLESVDRFTEHGMIVGLGALTPTSEHGELAFARVPDVITAMDELDEPLGDAVRDRVLDGWKVHARDEGLRFDRAFSIRHPEAARFPGQLRFLRALLGLARSVVTSDDALWAFEPFCDDGFDLTAR